MSSSRRRVTYGQLEVLEEILSANTDVALGYNKAAQARARSKEVWVQVASRLNSMGEGAKKTWKEWSMYWIDYKAKLEKKAAMARADMARSPSSAPDFNDIEQKFLRILGPNSGPGLPGVRVEPFPDARSEEIETVLCVSPHHEQRAEYEALDSEKQTTIDVSREFAPEKPTRKSKQHETVSSVKTPNVEKTFQDDDLTAFGNYIVSTLRNLSPRNCVAAQGDIFTILSKYKLRQLADSEAMFSGTTPGPLASD